MYVYSKQKLLALSKLLMCPMLNLTEAPPNPNYPKQFVDLKSVEIYRPNFDRYFYFLYLQGSLYHFCVPQL